MQRDAARKLTLGFRQQQPPIRRNVLSRQIRQLFVEILKAKAEAQRLRVLQKQLPRLLDLRRRFRWNDMESGCLHPINMPPLILSTCPVM